jgi:hypothetical protein
VKIFQRYHTLMYYVSSNHYYLRIHTLVILFICSKLIWPILNNRDDSRLINELCTCLSNYYRNSSKTIQLVVACNPTVKIKLIFYPKHIEHKIYRKYRLKTSKRKFVFYFMSKLQRTVWWTLMGPFFVIKKVNHEK